MVYRYRSGHGFKGISAQIVGETVDGMIRAHDGRITPADVVEESRPDEAPLHEIFEWDDATAAELHRESQARSIIRSYVVVRNAGTDEESEELANVSIASPYDDGGPAYVPARNAMEDPELRARIIALARAQLDGWQARYGHIEELAQAAEMVRQAREAAQQAVPARRRRGRRDAPAVAMA